MELLKDRIRRDGRVLGKDILKVDRFLNHQMDVSFISELGREFFRRFKDCGVNKILTIEASGIGIACLTATFFDVPVVFAKKNRTANLPDDMWMSRADSFTQGRTYDILVSREFLHPSDRVLLIDDFLANGHALSALIDLVAQAGGTVVGAGIVIEKTYQPGGTRIRERGVRVESLAQIQYMNEEQGVVFCPSDSAL
ncbi:MAG: xanthine phosphoribosyltransferase [Evtepia sp.]